MTAFDVTVPAVHHAATAAATVGHELRTELETLRAQADAVLGDEWLGRAAAAFERAWHDWHREASAAIAGLSELGDALRTSAVSYDESDDAGRTTLLQAAP